MNRLRALKTALIGAGAVVCVVGGALAAEINIPAGDLKSHSIPMCPKRVSN